MEESVRGARDNGLDGETARLGWGGVTEVAGRATRVFHLPDRRPVLLALRTPLRSRGGPLELNFTYCDTRSTPLRLEVIRGGTPLLLGELFGAGDGVWKERAFRLPADCRFETLPRLEADGGYDPAGAP